MTELVRCYQWVVREFPPDTYQPVCSGKECVAYSVIDTGVGKWWDCSMANIHHPLPKTKPGGRHEEEDPGGAADRQRGESRR
jgi:hypothetical protein